MLESLAIPGLGQLVVGNWTALVWLAIAIGGVVGGHQLAVPASLVVGSMVVLGLLSGEHAKRLVERRSSRPVAFASRIVSEARPGRAVSIRLDVDTRLNTRQLWRRVSKLPGFLAIDPFHERVVLMRSPPQAGVDMALYHNVFGLRFVRTGRILKWREGESFAFSDLSRRDWPRRAGRRTGFPHVFFVHVLPQGDHSQLVIQVRGKGTPQLVPMPLARLWLRWVFREHARLLVKAL